MIHGELGGFELAAAMMTDATIDLIQPPARLFELARLVTLALDAGRIGVLRTELMVLGHAGS